MEFRGPLLESNELPNESSDTISPIATLPTFVDFPPRHNKHQRPSALSSDLPHLSSDSAQDPNLLQAAMSDTEPEVVDLTASTPRRRTAIPVSSSPPTGMDYSPPFRGGQPGPSRGVKRRNDQQGESSSSSHTRQNNISVTMDLTGQSIPIELSQLFAYFRETEPTIPQVTMEGPSNPKRPRPNDKEAAPERLTHSDRVIHPPSRPDTNKLNEPSQNTALLAYRCPICLDRPTLWTSTICGMFLIP